MIKLTAGQETAKTRFMSWWNFRTKQTFIISGQAGTGKTFLVQYLIESIGLDLSEVMFLTYVGKATLALQKNGIPSQTIHSAICDYELVVMKDENGNAVYKDDGNVAMKPLFKRKESLPENIRLIVIDEGSMVDSVLGKWLIDYDIPIVVLLDMNQLPPVFGVPFFSQQPDVILTEIMRQSKDSPIPYFADKILKGNIIKYGSYGDKTILVTPRVNPDSYMNANVVICAKNKTRNKLNTFIREDLLGIHSENPVIGDKLICRKNNWTIVNDDGIALVNGLTGTIDDIYQENITKNVIPIDFKPEDFESTFYNIQLDRNAFKGEKNIKELKSFSPYEVFELGYVITCHLAQGSQYSKVLVVFETIGGNSFSQKWLYTAVTRAVDKLILIL